MKSIRFAEEHPAINGWVSCSFGKWIAKLTHTHQPPTEVGGFRQLDNKKYARTD
jgi:hypothetical protein